MILPASTHHMSYSWRRASAWGRENLLGDPVLPLPGQAPLPAASVSSPASPSSQGILPTCPLPRAHGPQAHRPLPSATQGRCPHRPGPWLLLWGGTCSAFLLEGQVNVQGSKAVLPFSGPWSTTLLTREGTEGMKDREGVPRGLPEAGGRGNPQARHLLQNQPWLPGQGAVGPRQPHWGLTGSQPPLSRIPSMEQ